MKITPSRINTLLTIGENLNIEFKHVGDGTLYYETDAKTIDDVISNLEADESKAAGDKSKDEGEGDKNVQENENDSSSDPGEENANSTSEREIPQ